MSFPFNIEKAIQAASVLLSHHEQKRMEYIRLLKLLYIADRESVAETGRPIIGSKVVAMRNGPLHSRIYSLVKGEDIAEPEWAQCFQTIGVTIQELQHPGVSQLARYEVRKLKEVHDRYQNTDTWALVEETHNFEEWRQHYPDPHENTSRIIPFADLAKAVGQGDELAAIEEDAREACEIDRLFG
jgi:uncharacterized phage-associated protein